jgi:glutaminyl-peptide cyclotransferase
MKRAILAILLATLVFGAIACGPSERGFSGKRALSWVEAQVNLGPRPTGSEANRKTAELIAQTLQRNGWRVETQEFAYNGLRVRNVIGKKGQGPVIILGAHYDTRPQADRDPTDRSQPVMGANDGGSGTAVLLELSRVLDEKATKQAEIWLAFFDAEDHGEIQGWPWSVGAGRVADSLAVRPEYVIVVDMVGDQDQRIYYEWTSSLWVQEKIWGTAAQLGYGEHFIPNHRYSILDDHTPFITWGMPAAVVIDLDYPYWHTTRDTLDKISADSLQRVGDVMETLLEEDPLDKSGLEDAKTESYPK